MHILILLREHADGAWWLRSKKRFSTLPFFFPIFLPLHSPKRENEPAAIRTTRTTVFRTLLRPGRPTISANNVANSRSGMEKGRRIARGARGGNRGENLLGAMESRAESEWRSPNRRMCYASWSRCATSRPPQHLRARAASWETHMARKYCSTSPTKLRNVRDSIDSRRNSR